MRILYDYPRSTASYRVRIALNLKGLRYQQQLIHLLKEGGQQNSEAFRRINPQGLVPCLQEGELIITESLAILDYLEETYPTPSILPQDTAARAFVRSIAQMIACDIHPLNNLRVLHYLRDVVSQDQPQQRQWYHHWLKQGFDAIETRIANYTSRGIYTHGDTPSIADICLVAQVYNARRYEFSLEPYPIIESIEKQCLVLKAFKLD